MSHTVQKPSVLKRVSQSILLSGIALMTAIALQLAPEDIAAQTKEETMDLPEIIAHRGASWLAPENTMASIQLAWAMDTDAVEIDIYLTADGEIVCFHDRSTGRISDQDQLVEELTLDELRQLDVGSWKGDQWEGERVITFEEALATVPRHRRLIVDVKSDTRIVEPMIEKINNSGLHPHQVVVIAFSYELAEMTKQLRPRTPVLWLVSFREESGQWSPSMDEVVSRAVDAGVDGVNLGFRGPAREPGEVEKIREAGLGYYVWTVNEPDDAQLALELGVDGLTTDRPAWLKKQLFARNGWTLLPRP